MSTSHPDSQSEPGDVPPDLARFMDDWADAIVSNDVARMSEFTTDDWILIDRPGTITREAFHAVVDSEALQHLSMTHDVLGISTFSEVAVIRTRGRNTATFNGEMLSADEWTTNLVIRDRGRWRCVLTQLTPTHADDLVQVSRVAPDQWQRLRDMRLAALAESPDMFGSTLAREEGFDEDEWRRRASRPVTYVATRGGRDVGLAGVHEFDGTWQVVSMWIDPGSRGKGIVDGLMRACEATAREAGADRLTLGVMEDNPAGRTAYRRLGFAFTGRRDHIREGRDELWMEKRLT